MTSIQHFPYVSPWAVLACWPAEQPRLFLGGNGRFCALGLVFSACDNLDAWSLRLAPALDVGNKPPFAPGFVSLVSYDDFVPGGIAGSTSRTWQVDSFLVWDQRNRTLAVTGELGRPGQQVLEALLNRAKSTVDPTDCGGWNWRAKTSGSDYLARARQVLEDIRDGRYYQLNLLRYFQICGVPARTEIVGRLAAVGGKYSAWIDDAGIQLVSFSPERFVRIGNGSEGLRICTFPIKGTAKRYQDVDSDVASRTRLLSSPKEHAELNMIIDLMRHDLQKISRPGSVLVEDTGSLLVLPHVYHRQGRVSATLVAGCRVNDVLKAVCPAGSITGAPKHEVMLASREFEGRDRGFFMGNLVYWRADGSSLDSSVLIRTMVSTERNIYEFAAGSGMVLESIPEREQDEISQKCRVVMATCAE